ncbi:MAG: aldo/keto reductase [Chloroflexi bacterium]|nr:aldo/keto reductase [Chloroflexota bacterium]
MKRRTFLKTVGGVTGGLALNANQILSAEKSETSTAVETVAGLPRRVLGRTGQKLSIVGFPGLSLIHYDQKRCDEGLRSAFDRGVNYFDVAPAYGNGQCETKMGLGLQGLDRSRYFLACKTKMRDKEGARRELEQSLKLLKTDHFDLYQMHHLVKPEDVKRALGPGGAIETFLKAQEEGKVKYLGFSAHTTKGALEALKGFRFDTAMFPINFVEFYLRGFGKEVIDLANEQGAAILAIKPMSRGAWPKGMERTRQWWYRSVEEGREVDGAWRFTLSQKGVVAGIPPSFLDLLDKAIEAARNYRPPTAPELEELQRIAKTCESIFLREDTQVAGATPCHGPVFPDSPHECGYGHIA